MFLLPFALMILIGSTTAFGSSERFSSFFGSAAAAGAAAFLMVFLAFGALAGSATTATVAGASAAAGATSAVAASASASGALGFLESGIYVRFWLAYLPAFASFARCTPTVLRGPLRV